MTRVVSSTPVSVPGLTGVTAIALGTFHTCALRADGRVACWGENKEGQLGDGTTVDSPTPVVVAGVTGVTEISAGAYGTCALLSSGEIRCWGENRQSELGTGTAASFSATPVSIVGIARATEVSVGYASSCALLPDGTVQCWGDDTYGELGDGTTMLSGSIPTPRAVSGLTGVAAVAAGGDFACALLGAGTVECWGTNSAGQIGGGAGGNGSSTPVVVNP
jgi:alpha-tubulin suppressor-like RCC1 family protein